MKKLIISSLFILLGTVCYAQTYSLYGYSNGSYYVFLGSFEVRGNQIVDDQYGANSIFNKYGKYGSEYQNTIWNQYQNYGSPYQSTSCTNQYATNPPLIVDRNMNRVGYLSKNNYVSGQTQFGRDVSRIILGVR